MSKKFILKRSYETGFNKREIDEARFTIDYAHDLNPSQFEAASAVEGAYLVIAGAGTGKTRTLVYRVARLIESGYDPTSILLLTFTRKASKEMLNRAAILLDNRCSRINGGTFHSFANLTLRKYAKSVGLHSGFTILDQTDSTDIINLIRAQLSYDKLKKRFPNKSTINKILSLSINTARKVEDIVEVDYPHFFEFVDEIQKVQQVFANYKRKNNLVDYDDLLLYLREFLNTKNSGVESLLSKINFVMVDEYQDTNKIQADIVKGLVQYQNNVMVVGDDSQSIYSFRGADFKNIMQFPTLFNNTKIIKLEENYRSSQEILNFTNHIIEGAIEKFSKNLFSRKVDGELPGIISATNENMQSRFIVERILELREEGISLSNIAVLFRSSYFSFDLEIELNKANIPFVKVGGMKFMEAAHVKDTLAFLRIASNPKDIVSWYRILLLHESIGPKTAQKIIEDLIGDSPTVDFNIISETRKKYKPNILKLIKFLENLSQEKGLPTELAEKAIEYYNPLFKNKYDDHNKRKKDLEMFLNISENYKSLATFLADMALDPPQDSVVEIDPEDNENEKLILSTIHSAKGLEWHTVFIIHAMEGFFPSAQSFQNIENMEEERRLMYVASTRAKQNLYVCYPMNIFDRQQGLTFSKPSRFISDISDDLADEWLLEEAF